MGFFDKIFSGTIDDKTKNIDAKERLRELDDELGQLEEFVEEASEAEPSPDEEKSGKRGLFGGKDKKKRPKDDVLVDDLYEKKKKVLNKYAAAMAAGSIFVLMVLAAIILFTREEPRTQKRANVTAPKEEGVSFQENDLWKTRTSNKIQRLERAIVDVRETTKQELNATKNELMGAIEQLGGNLRDTLSAMQESTERQSVEIKREIAETKQELRDYTDEKVAQASTSTVKKFENRIAEKLVSVKKGAVTFNGDLTMLPPPPIEGGSAATTKKSGAPLPLPLPAPTKKSTGPKATENAEEKAAIEKQKALAKADVEALPVDTSVDYNATLPVRKEAEKEPPLHIMTGLAEATLITGVSAATFGEGVKSPKMVMLSVKGDLFGANDHTENLSDCLLFATATGNMNTKRAELLVTRLSCSIYDNGKYYKIEQTGNPLGWVIGEDGKYGLKGRLVSSAAEVVLRQLIVGFLQGVATAFATPSVGYVPQSYYGGGGDNQIVDSQKAFSGGVSGGANSALNSLAEYYQQMLDGLYPYIDIKAGRQVSVIFMGFQDTIKTRYIPIDVTSDYGDEGDEFEEVEIDENDF